MDEEKDTFPDVGSAAPSDVACSACAGRKRKAELSCLQCLASYCEDHLDAHNDLHGKRHKLVAATGRLEELVCPEHDKLMEVFCRTDKKCICHMCILHEHIAHDVVSIDCEVAELKSALGTTRRETTDRIESRQSEMLALKQAIEDFQTSVRQLVAENETKFTELIRFVEMKRDEVKEKILAQEQAAVKKAKEHLERLPSEIAYLRRRDFELQRLERLSQADNGVYFLQGILSTPALSSSVPCPALFVHPYSSFQLATEAVSDLIKQMRRVCSSYSANITRHVQMADILPPPVWKIREALLQHASTLTLNPNTAHMSLLLSKGNREVKAVHQAQDYPNHPDRFDYKVQILCIEALRGTPQYWEVDIKVNNWVCIAVTYTTIYRKEKNKCGHLGRNNYSWGLRCYPNLYQFWHGNKRIAIEPNKRCSRIGVYLDPGLGILEFYNVLDDMSLIYKAQTKFTESVYAGFGMGGKGSSVTLCDLEEKVMGGE